MSDFVRSYLRRVWRGGAFLFVAVSALFVIGYTFHIDIKLAKYLGIAISVMALIIMLWPSRKRE